MVGGFVEAGEADIANSGLQQKGDVYGGAGDFVACDGKDERLGIAFAGDCDFYDGALATLEHVGDIAGGEAVRRLVVDLDDYVAGANTGVIGRRADVRSHDYGVVLAGGDDHAYAVVLAALIFTQEGELAGIEEIGVGVEHAEHAGDGTLVDGLIHVD